MKKILCILTALTFLTGCALTTIRPFKKTAAKRPEPAKKSVVQKVKEVFTPKPEPAASKEEVLPMETEAKEEVLPEEDIK